LDPEFPEALDWGDRRMWALNHSYFINPVNVSSLNIETCFVDNVTCRSLDASSFWVNLSDAAGPLVLTDTSTGFAQISPRSISNTTATVYVTISGYPDLPIGNISLDVRVEDIYNPTATGPGGADCLNGGVKTDGMSEFDLHYTCDCTGTGFIGNNCNDRVVLVLDNPVLQIDDPDYSDALDWGNRSMWALNNVYYLKPVHIGSVSLSSGEQIPNTSLLRYSIVAESGGPRVLTDALTGFAQLTPRGSVRNTSATVYLTISGYPSLAIANITFDVRFKDVDNPNATGPAGMNCLNEGAKTDTYVLHFLLIFLT